MYICRERRVWEYEKDGYREILKTSESRWSMMKNMWERMEKDSTLENKLRKLLEKKNS